MDITLQSVPLERRHPCLPLLEQSQVGTAACTPRGVRLHHRLAGQWLQFINTRSSATLAVAAFLLTVAVMFMYRPFSQAESGDSAVYDYIAQLIVRGQVPYRDEIEKGLRSQGYHRCTSAAYLIRGVVVGSSLPRWRSVLAESVRSIAGGAEFADLATLRALDRRRWTA